jgi:hypothetical protein
LVSTAAAHELQESGEHSGDVCAEKVVMSKPSSLFRAGGSMLVVKEASGPNGTHARLSRSYSSSWAS